MDKLIGNLSQRLQKEFSLSEDNKEVVDFGLYMFFSNASGFLAIVIVGWILGVLKLALVAVLTASVLRVFSGGAHSENMRNCTLLGAVVSPGTALIARDASPYVSNLVLGLLITGVGLFSFWSVLRYAPADTPNKPITAPEARRRYRNLSLVSLVVWSALIGGSSLKLLGSLSSDLLLASTLGLLWQAFSLTPWGYRLVAGIDALMP